MNIGPLSQQADSSPTQSAGEPFAHKKPPSLRMGARCLGVTPENYELLVDLGDDAGTDGTATLTDSETQALLDGDGGDQLNVHDDIVAGHAHIGALGQGDDAGDVSGTEVELRTVVVEEGGMTAAFLLGQDVNLASKLGQRMNGAGLAQTWPRSMFFLSIPRSRAPMLSPASA